ncbi:hypothetical protein GH714_038396 [Hevea brasiliensis]|uniref:AN1-type domain-containing protein n=1 Tax=Hevea brasiliensis TaxID=3981 RepID=A0A6A6KMM6_HEVBR|nr:hypothetical protein GH714_038396 [Hevea brasiliensis]
MNLCSKCYSDYCLKERQQQQEASVKASLYVSSSLPSVPVGDSQPSPAIALPEVRSPATEVPAAVEQPSRCFTCRKRVGLSGFKCRCGITFCGTHRMIDAVYRAW